MNWFWLALLLAGCVAPAPLTTEDDPPLYAARPLRPDNCGTPDRPVPCQQKGEEHPFHIIWTPEPFYPVITEPLPDLTPPPDTDWEQPTSKDSD